MPNFALDGMALILSAPPPQFDQPQQKEKSKSEGSLFAHVGLFEAHLIEMAADPYFRRFRK